jgi:hypothetical protein
MIQFFKLKILNRMGLLVLMLFPVVAEAAPLSSRNKLEKCYALYPNDTRSIPFRGLVELGIGMSGGPGEFEEGAGFRPHVTVMWQLFSNIFVGADYSYHSYFFGESTFHISHSIGSEVRYYIPFFPLRTTAAGLKYIYGVSTAGYVWERTGTETDISSTTTDGGGIFVRIGLGVDFIQSAIMTIGVQFYYQFNLWDVEKFPGEKLHVDYAGFGIKLNYFF